MKYKIRGQIISAIIIFSISVVFGFLSAASNPEKASVFVDAILEDFNFIEQLGSIGILFFIFANNAVKAFAVVLGGLLFGIVPLFFLVVNGQVMGIFLSLFLAHIGLVAFLSGILPHGILEIPAIIISCAYGFWLGNSMYRRVRFQEPLREKIAYALSRFVKIVIPLLALAAIIETFVTPVIINLFI